MTRPATRRCLNVISSILLYASTTMLVIISLVPVVWMLSTSIKLPTETYTVPPQWVPNHPTIQNYVRVFRDKRVIDGFKNSIIIASGVSFLAVVFGLMAAYGFSRFDFPGSRILSAIMLATRMFPMVLTLVPFFVVLRGLGLYDTYPGLIWVYLGVILPLTIWLLKGFINNVPRELEEAAFIDGCSQLSVLWWIILPISAPGIFAIWMYAFITAWNEYLLGLVLSGSKTRPVTVSLVYYLGETITEWGPLMAAAVLVTLPALLGFFFFQGVLVKGLVEGALKS